MLAFTPTASAVASPARAADPAAASRACPPSAAAVSFSDSLDKLVYNGVELGGLSDLAYDPRSRATVASVDNHATDPARIWFFRNLSNPQVIRDPLVLRKPDGTPYDGTTSDNEGLAVLPDGDYLVSSETEPSIRIYDRTTGIQKASLPIPARFAVTGTTAAGQATNRSAASRRSLRS
jgi:WD40 repeat protein